MKRINSLIFIFRQKMINKNKIRSYNVDPKVSLGKNIEIMENTFIDSHSSIGSYTYIGLNNFVTKSDIGNYCSIANNVSIGSGEHLLDKISTSSFFYNHSYDTLTKAPCTIGNDVWIGVDSIILRGVTVGDGAVIGANSVVTKDVPPFSVVVGSPARVLKFRFSPETIKEISKSKWWNFNMEDSRKIIEDLERINING